MRKILKIIVFVISFIIVYHLILIDKIEKYFFKSEQAFVFMGTMLGFIPGLPGSYLRAAYYFATLDEASWEVHIGFGSLFCHRSAKVDRYTSIGMYCILGCVTIGKKVMLANRVSVPSGKYQHIDGCGNIKHDTKKEKVNLGKGAWVGEGSIIMADIGDGCIIGAGSVVTKAVPSDVVAAGNPAKVIRSLKQNTNVAPKNG